MKETPEKKVLVVDKMRSGILESTKITDKELAKQIAREWIRRVR